MLLESPPALHYPITVTELLQKPDDHVNRSAPLFEYSFQSTVTEGDEFGNTREVQRTFPTTFESTVEGTLRSWQIQRGSVITRPSVPLVNIEEACTHDIQFGGLCVNCGKDMTEVDYNTSVPNTQRANTAVPHIHPALKISNEEAARIDQEAKHRLLNTRKLSLVVDLDLTIIHASVDPTIGEWQRDEKHPNHRALKDVRSFELYDDAMQRDVSYYIKLRPHLKQFLETVSQLYELYIYTMGTRAYADNIAKIVDADKKLFGERILSRTETPGEDSKNLRKLFPVDNRMVVIIDDRADVWKWSNYLVRVQPFNFFVGIGDINASFLPKRDDILETAPAADTAPDPRKDSAEGATQPAPAPAPTAETALPTPPISPNASGDGDESALGQIVDMQESNADESMEKKTAEQDEDIATQLNERPLLQLQKHLEDEQVPEDHGLLKDDDAELVRVQDILVKVHDGFFRQYDATRIEKMAGTRTQQEVHDIRSVPDVKDIIEPLVAKPLRDAKIVFSRIVPLDVDIFKTRWADMAMKLGALVQMELRDDTTHLVAKGGDPTLKMRKAAARGIRIVRDDWLWDQSIQWWGKIDEEPYTIHVDPGSAKSRNFGGDISGDSLRNSEDEDDAGGMGLRVNTNINGDGEDEEQLRSPEGDVRDAGWDAAFSEDDEFDDEDDDDSDGENEEDAANSDASSSQMSTLSIRGQKRKRGEEEEAGTGGWNKATISGAGDSMLQKRKRKALARTSSLTNVQQADASEREVGGRSEEEEDDFDEEALMAALEEEDDEDETPLTQDNATDDKG